MSKFPHDDFAKAYLTELLSTIGKATPNRPLKNETRLADLWFEINPKFAERRAELGLLGELLTRDALIEVFRNPATPVEIRTCQSKLSTLETELLNKAKRNKETLLEYQLPYLWLIMPTASENIHEGFGTIGTEISGVYHFPSLQRTGLIVVHQLPKTENTLFLRVLGRAGEQRRAMAYGRSLTIEEVVRHPVSPLYTSIEELLANDRTDLENLRPITPEEEELIMNLSTAYLKKREEWKQEGIESGISQGIGIGRQQNSYEVAANLLKEGLSVEFIMKVTGLTAAQIQSITIQATET